MNVESGLFFLALIVLIGIFLLKVYNMMTTCGLYDNKWTFLTLIGSFLSFFIMYLVFVVNYEEIVLMQLYGLGTAILLLVVIASIIELFINLGKAGTGYASRKRYVRE